MSKREINTISLRLFGKMVPKKGTKDHEEFLKIKEKVAKDLSKGVDPFRLALKEAKIINPKKGTEQYKQVQERKKQIQEEREKVDNRLDELEKLRKELTEVKQQNKQLKQKLKIVDRLKQTVKNPKKSKKKEIYEAMVDLEIQPYDTENKEEKKEEIKKKIEKRIFIRATSNEEALKKALAFANLKERSKTEHIPGWLSSIEIKDIRRSKNPTEEDLKNAIMLKVKPLLGYEMFNASLNEDDNSGDYCVIRYLKKTIEPVTSKGMRLAGNKSHGRFPNVNSEFFYKFFNALRLYKQDPQSMFDISIPQLDLLDTTPVTGVSPKEIDEFCRYYGFSHYAVDMLGKNVFYYVPEKNNKLPAISYLTNGQHLYPIDDEAERIKLRERNKKRGLYAKSFKPKNPENKDEVEAQSAGGCPLEKDFKKNGNFQIATTIKDATDRNLKGVVFLTSDEVDLTGFMIDETKRQKKIFDRKSYQFNKDGNICSFKPNDEVKFRLHKDVELVVECCEILKTPFVGQSLSTIGIKYLESNGNKIKSSFLNNQVFNLLMTTFRGGICNTFNKAENMDNLIGYDINKAYTSILLDKTNDFPIFNAFCQIKEIKDQSLQFDDSTLYLIVNCKNFFPLRYDGIYYGFELTYAKSLGISFTVTGKITPSDYLDDYSDQIQKMYDELGPKHAKILINNFVGMMGVNKQTKYNAYFAQSLCEAAHIRLHKMGKDAFVGEVCADPVLYEVKEKQRSNIVETNMPINMYIVRKTWVKVHQLATQMGGKIIRVITDCVITEGGKEIPTGNNPGQYKKLTLEECKQKVKKSRKINVPKREDILKFEQSQRKKNEHVCQDFDDIYFKLPKDTKTEWNLIDAKEENWESPDWAESVADKIFESGSCLLTGLAGTGKSNISKCLIKLLQQKSHKIFPTAFTNNAANIIKGTTLHRLFGLNATDPISKSKISAIKKDDWVLVDEISLVSSEFYNVFIKLKMKGVNFVIVGDFNQLPAIDNCRIDKENSIVLKQLCDSNKIELKINKRSNDKMFNLFLKVLDNKFDINDFQTSDEDPREDEVHITQCNLQREMINEFLQKELSKNFKKTLLIPYYYDEKKKIDRPEIILWKGAPVEAHSNSLKNHGIYNNQQFKVKSWDEDDVYLIGNDRNDEEQEYVIPIAIFQSIIQSGFATTCHRVQGRTIKDKRIRIWNIDSEYVDKKWIYTAISRTNDWNNIYITV